MGKEKYRLSRWKYAEKRKEKYMKKRDKAVYLLTVAVFAGMQFSACKNGEKDYININEYDAGKITAEQTFSFESDLSEQQKIYPESRGRTFYVAQAGKSGNSGMNKDKPLKSVADVNSLSLLPGDKILFKRGDVFSGTQLEITTSGEQDNPIYFGAYGNGKDNPIITGSFNGVVKLSKVSNIVVEGLDVLVRDAPILSSATNTQRKVGILAAYENLAPDGSESYKNIYICNNNVYSSDAINTNDTGIIIFGLYPDFGSCPSNQVNNVWVTGNTVRNFGRCGIVSSYWVSEGDASGNGNGGRRDAFTNFHFDGNTVYNIGYIGMYLQCASDSTINRNLVYGTGKTTTDFAGEGDCGIMALSCENVDIMFNETFDNCMGCYTWDAMGIDIDWNTVNINVQYNYCYDNDGAGIGTMANRDSFIRNNKIVDNRMKAKQHYDIYVGDFTARYAGVSEDMHSVKNLKISDNLCIATKPVGEDSKNISFFGTLAENGDPDWSGNAYERNHNVSRISEPEERIVWVDTASQRTWDKFADNRYYGLGGDSFLAYDYAKTESLVFGEAYGNTMLFSDWKKRDMGATFEKVSYAEPDKVKDMAAEFDRETSRLTLRWTGAGAWHYNVYSVGETEKQAYRNMLGEAFENAFSYRLSHKGNYWFVVEPESDTGIVGEPVKIKVEVK